MEAIGIIVDPGNVKNKSGLNLPVLISWFFINMSLTHVASSQSYSISKCNLIAIVIFFKVSLFTLPIAAELICCLDIVLIR